ncbi:MAG: tyrosine/phenylalanine carboxypeptidase domain-containing protein [Cyclobacteriaceae bacterium]
MGNEVKDTVEDRVARRISQGKRVNVLLPDGGKLSMDRKFPFLCLYRFSKEDRDESMIRLVKAQANYLLLPQESYPATEKARNLIRLIVQGHEDEFDAFLLVEIWSYRDEEEDIPAFSIFSPRTMAKETTTTLVNGMKELSLMVPNAIVKIERGDNRHPVSKGSVFSMDECTEIGVLNLGVRIPYFFGSTDKITYPISFRAFRRKFTRIVKKAIYGFIRVQTSNPFDNFGVLGTDLLEERVLEVDHQLAQINNSYDFLLAMSPVNVGEQWEQFCKSNYRELPVFHYRLLPSDPEKMKRDLYDISIDRIEDPTLAFLLHDKRSEMDKEISMLEERNTEQFMYNSFRMYGKPDDKLINVARHILKEFNSLDSEDHERVTPEEFKLRAETYINALRSQAPEFGCDIRIRKDLNGIMVNRGCLMISNTFNSAAHRVYPLLEHEIGTHSLTYYNGQKQPLQLFYIGLAGYDEWQEGLAVFSEYMSDGLTRSRMRMLAARVIASDCLARGADFIENFSMLHEQYNFPARTAFNITTRIHRGGGLTKDSIYLRGLLKLLDYMKDHDTMDHLYIGKIAEKHIPYIEELLYRNILKKPEVLPLFLHQNKLKEKLDQIRNYHSITELAKY